MYIYYGMVANRWPINRSPVFKWLSLHKHTESGLGRFESGLTDTHGQCVCTICSGSTNISVAVHKSSLVPTM